MSYKLNQLLTENQAVGTSSGHLKERQAILERELDIKNDEIESLRNKLHESKRVLTGSVAKTNEENIRLQERLYLIDTENTGLKQQLGDL